MNRTAVASLAAAFLCACSGWQEVPAVIPPDLPLDQRVESVLAKMSVEEKVGQLMIVDMESIRPRDLRRYPIGAILNGGTSAPGNDRRDPASWLADVDDYGRAARAREGTFVPLIWGTDAVHGHNNVRGATLYPQNIGLGATRDADLVRRIGEATAVEVQATGMDWTFAPVVAVVQDAFWGRTYESFSEDPAVVASLGAASVEGLQGKAGTQAFLDDRHVIATGKHFLGDGGTKGGVDQGETAGDEETLRKVHAAGYVSTIGAGLQTVMASYSSWEGRKMHGNRDLLTGVLKGDMGFDGFVVGDWLAHSQVPGCSVDRCAAAVEAGVDMLMMTGDWRALYQHTLEEAQGGTIASVRLDDAVRRILRVKMRAGLFDKPLPAKRPLAGHFELLGSAAHRALAREAVRKSLVLLKNENALLPLPRKLNVLVAGDVADDIGRQSGGWSVSWQGITADNAKFPGAESIWSGIRKAVEAGGGRAQLSVGGRYKQKPDVAIVVFGERPYAEFHGNVQTLDFGALQPDARLLLKRLRDAGIPTVSVFTSGRPMWITPELESSNAFVAAWLPGSEGGGVADVLFRSASGVAGYDFTGTLPFSWPRTPTSVTAEEGRRGESLFPIGYGMRYTTLGVPASDASAAPVTR